MADPIPVEPGQVWADKNQWHAGRTVRVVEVDGTRAVVEVVTMAHHRGRAAAYTVGRCSRVLYDHRGLHGYRLVDDAGGE